MEITLTVSLPDFRPDIAEFAVRHNLPVFFGPYITDDDDDEPDFALLINVGYTELQNRPDAEALTLELRRLTGPEDWDIYTGEEYWINFADEEALAACVEQVGTNLRSLYPEVRFELTEFLE